MRHAIINKDNIVVNVIEWDGKNGWRPPQGCRVIPSVYASMGDWYNEKEKRFVRSYIVDVREADLKPV